MVTAGQQQYLAPGAMPILKEVRIVGNPWKMLALTGIGFALAAYPVYQHSKQADKGNMYAASKKKARADKLAWMESDEMPVK